MSSQATEAVRPDFVPKAHYISDEITDLENKRLWPRVWQVAGRVEELTRVGDFLRYDVGDQSVLVVRNDAGTLRPSTTSALIAAIN